MSADKLFVPMSTEEMELEEDGVDEYEDNHFNDSFLIVLNITS